MGFRTRGVEQLLDVRTVRIERGLGNSEAVHLAQGGLGAARIASEL
jgi:hypothetical protein